jgi:uncharacterized membrane protein YkoI
MNRQWRSVGVVGVVLLAAFAFADEKKIKISELPEKVVAAVKDKFPGAEITGAEKETEDGKTIYEVEVKHNGKKIEAEFSPEGEFLEMEWVIDIKELPETVSNAIKEKYPNATLKRAEKMTKKDDSVLYEVVIQSGDKKGEIVVDTTGKIVKDLKTEKQD